MIKPLKRVSGIYSDALAEKCLELLSSDDFIKVLPIESAICIQAARLGASHRLKTIDAIHFASATLAGCQALLSNDGGMRSTEALRAIQLVEFEGGEEWS